MNGMDRAGRVMQFKRILMRECTRSQDCWMTTGQVCRKAGVKSSTRFKQMLFEIALECDGFMWREDRGMREYAFVMPTQLELPERFITINGNSHRVAGWVGVARKVGANA